MRALTFSLITLPENLKHKINFL